MRFEFLASVLGLATTACALQTPGDDGSGGSGGGGGGGSTGGWTAMPLVDDTSNPDRIIYHKGNDRVTGIYFESADKGFVVSQGEGETAVRGGAVFKTTGTEVKSVAFSGDSTGITLLGSVDFVGLEKTPTGYLAMAYASDVIASRDGGNTFTIEKNGTDFGIENVLGYKVTSSGTTIVPDARIVSVSSTAPGPSATYTDVWAPNGSPMIPAELTPDMCTGGPFGPGVPATRYSVYISPDRNFLAYTSNPGTYEPQVCTSTDGGHTFYAHKLTVPSSADNFPPTGVTFTNTQNGITWFTSSAAGAYIKHTTDGGKTWTDVPLPSDVATDSFQLPAAWFAPDGQHGWIAGYDLDTSRALLLATSDGGATWKTVPGVAEAAAAAGGDKLYAGFALDADHVWIGGERGLLMHN